MLGVKNLDQFNLALIILCAGLSYILPFELVLLSYAILGPAHYLTQINWLHQRKYFAPNWPFLYPALAATVISVLFSGVRGPALFIAVILAIISVLQIRQLYGWLIAAVACLVYLPLASHLSVLELAFAVLLPTVIHVFVFTVVFMLGGALRSRSVWGMAAVGAMLVCSILFFIFPPSHQPVFEGFVSANSPLFSRILEKLGHTFGFTPTPTLMGSFMAFLSFAYTYHYLNWFSKAEVIHWHKTTPFAWGCIIICYLMAVGTYLYDYQTGFLLLLFLSLLHVVLEFPLNVRSFQSLPSLLKSYLARHPA